MTAGGKQFEQTTIDGDADPVRTKARKRSGGITQRRSASPKRDSLSGLSGKDPVQLPMFMKPGEIKDQYEPANGDRQGVVDFTQMPPTRKETDNELYQRKLTEAVSNRRSFFNTKTGQVEQKPTLHNQIAISGGVKGPVHLQATDQEYGSWPRGKEGGYQVMDGLHRVAEREAFAPEQLLPVEHHETGYSSEHAHALRTDKAYRQEYLAMRARNEERTGKKTRAWIPPYQEPGV
jgi:hypothetical protein